MALKRNKKQAKLSQRISRSTYDVCQVAFCLRRTRSLAPILYRLIKKYIFILFHFAHCVAKTTRKLCVRIAYCVSCAKNKKRNIKMRYERRHKKPQNNDGDDDEKEAQIASCFLRLAVFCLLLRAVILGARFAKIKAIDHFAIRRIRIRSTTLMCSSKRRSGREREVMQVCCLNVLQLESQVSAQPSRFRKHLRIFSYFLCFFFGGATTIAPR